MNPPDSANARTTPAAALANADLARIERPVPPQATSAGFGSDVVAQTLRDLGIPYIALNPGASYRGLHDSLVNYLGNETPQMLLCLHEETAIAVAHGYAKVTGRAMAAAVHSNVGLAHASMAIFNAWCDRMPIVILGATGPVDAMKRRPWIDWIHTAADQGAMVRPYTKWDNQPASPGAAREALLRATWLANTAPMAPVYINLDAGMQEEKLAEPLPPIDAARFVPGTASAAPAHQVAEGAKLLADAKNPIIVIGRVSRGREDWDARVALAERLGARVLTDIKVGCSFPTDHPLCAGAPVGLIPHKDAVEALRAADVILSLDWVDLSGLLKVAGITSTSDVRIIKASVDHHLHNGWSMDHQGLPPADIMLAAHPDHVLPDLLAALGPGGSARQAAPPAKAAAVAPQQTSDTPTVESVALTLKRLVGARPVTLAHLPLSWQGAWWDFRDPLDFVGSDGGAGIGAGPGISVGVALALQKSGRLCIGVCGDGDFLMGVTAVWTAVHYRLPLLLVIVNNRSFFNDELHQERVARMRDRPVENRWIGQRMADPELDLATLARGQGAKGIGPVTSQADLERALQSAIEAVDAGEVVVVDVHVEVGYPGG